MRHLICGTAFFVAMALLLAIVAGCAQAHQTGLGNGGPSSADNVDRAEDTAGICLALVGGTALLAGGVWISRLRRLTP